MSTDQAWADLRDGLPDHATEVMSARGGQPTVQEQDRNNGAGMPDVDLGADDQAKYCC